MFILQPHLEDIILNFGAPHLQSFVFESLKTKFLTKNQSLKE